MISSNQASTFWVFYWNLSFFSNDLLRNFAMPEGLISILWPAFQPRCLYDKDTESYQGQGQVFILSATTAVLETDKKIEQFYTYKIQEKCYKIIK